GVVRILDGDRVVLHATTKESAPVEDPMSLGAWSPRWRPHCGPMIRIDDARSELDPTYPMDAKLLASGLASGLWEPFGTGRAFAGGVWLCPSAPPQSPGAPRARLRRIAALLGSAVEHWRIWDRARRRQDRLNGVESLQRTLATSLDVRDVFQQLAAELQSI